MHVTLVGGFDPAQAAIGGTRSYIVNLARLLRDYGIPHLVLLAGQSAGRGTDWCSVPVRRGGSTTHFLASLLVHVGSLPIPADSVIHVQRPDHLIPFFLGRVGGNWMCTLHGDAHRAINERNPLIVAGADALAERFLLGRARSVVAVDSQTARDYGTRYPQLRNRLEVIPNAVDLIEFRPLERALCRRKWGLGENVLLYAGRLEPEKRVADIVKAFCELDDQTATLVIAGDGTERKSLERETRDPRVRFLGPIGRSDMVSLLNAADGLVLFSTREGLPSVALEALACGVPVISTPVGDMHKLIQSGLNGILVADYAQLVDSMRELMRRKLGSSASIAESSRPYSWSELGPAWLRLYERVASS